jgi:hypothetical protein
VRPRDRADAEIALEERNEILGGDADPLVGDADDDVGAPGLAPHDDQASLGRVLDGVVQDVAQDLANPVRVGRHDGESR